MVSKVLIFLLFQEGHEWNLKENGKFFQRHYKLCLITLNLYHILDHTPYKVHKVSKCLVLFYLRKGHGWKVAIFLKGNLNVPYGPASLSGVNPPGVNLPM